MSLRRLASRTLFALGLLLLLGAFGLLAASWLLPAQGLEDLGRVVGAMLVAGLAGIAFAVGLLVTPPAGVPRWQVALSALGCLPAALAGAAFASTGTTPLMAFGLLVVGLSLAGLVSAWRLVRAAPQRVL